jgi:hypothetical protein
MEDIVERLEAANEYCESSESKQLRKDAAEEIRALRRQIAEMNNAMLRKNSNKMQRRAA